MSFTIKQLKEALQNGWLDDSHILVDGKHIKGIQNLNDNTLYISTEPKIGECKKCGHAVYRNPYYQGGEYLTKCPQCQIDLTARNIILVTFGENSI